MYFQLPSSASVFNQQRGSNQGDGILGTASSGGNISNENTNPENYVIYHINETPEKRDINNQYDEENVLNTPMVKKELERNQKKTDKPQSQRNPQNKFNKLNIPTSTGTKSKATNTILQNHPEIRTEKDLDPLIFLDISQDSQQENLNSTSISDQKQKKKTKLWMISKCIQAKKILSVQKFLIFLRILQ